MARKQSQFLLMLLIFSAAGLLILAFGIVLWNSQHQSIKALRADTDELQNQINVINEHIAAMDSLDKEKADIEIKLSSLDRNLVNYKYIPTYLAEIQKAAEVSDNRLLAIQPQEVKSLASSVLLQQPAQMTTITSQATTQVVTDTPAPAPAAPAGGTGVDRYKVQRINLEISGTYASSMQMLDLLRQFPKLVYLRSLNLNPTGDEGVRLHLETYAIIIPDQFKAPVENAAALAQGRGEPSTAAPLPEGSVQQ
ncbi:MAG: hypothetical protein ACYC7E_08835 [Armatimonadota bacterium]